MNTLLEALGGVAAAGAAAVGYASLVERNAYALRRFSVPVLPAGLTSAAGAAPVATCTSCRASAARSSGCAAWPPSSPTSSSTPATTSPHPDAVPALLERHGAAAGASPACSSSARTTTSRRRPRTPRSTSPRGHRRGTASTPRLPTEDLVKGLARGGWTDLTNRRATSRSAGTSSSSSASTTPTSTTTGTASWRAPPTPRRADGRGDARALPAGARRHDGRRRGAGDRRAHARRPARPALLRRARHQLRPRHAAGPRGLAVVAGRRPHAVVASPRTTRPGCTCRPDSGPRPTRRCASPAARRRRCSPSSPADPAVPAVPLSGDPIEGRDHPRCLLG